MIIIIISQGPVSAWQVRHRKVHPEKETRVTSKYIIEDATCFRISNQEFSRCKKLHFHYVRWKERQKIQEVSAIELAFRAPTANHNLQDDLHTSWS